MQVIEVRRAAEDDTSLITKNGKVLKFENDIEAREFAVNNIEGSMRYSFIIQWEIISEEKAKSLGHKI